MRTPGQHKPAFTLVELLMVLAVTATLLSLLLPALAGARRWSRQVACAASLQQTGVCLAAYVADNQGRLPYIESALWRSDGTLDWTADPTDGAAHPHEYFPVLGTYLAQERWVCPEQVAGYPQQAPALTYRLAAANNYDGQIGPVLLPGGGPKYVYSLKYLDGRRYEVQYVDATVFPFALRPGAGPFYLARDMVGHDAAGKLRPPHRGSANQLYLDMHVALFRDQSEFGLSYP